MTGSPFSNVLGTDQDSSHFQNVESTQTSDTTSQTAVAPTDTGTEPAPGVIVGPGGTHVSEQDETAGDPPTGQ